MHDLTAFQRDLLYVIASKDEQHGLAIKDELDGYYETEINHGRLYPNLDTLVSKGLVEKGRIEFERVGEDYAVNRIAEKLLNDLHRRFKNSSVRSSTTQARSSPRLPRSTMGSNSVMIFTT